MRNDKKSLISPHHTSRDLELIWVSMARPNHKPLYIGVYYGLQEGVNNERIGIEMDNLSEEILEIKNDGEIVLCMDANAKIGLMGEAESRNGKLIKEVFYECDVEIMNQNEKCEGVVTRQNRNKENEKSAIDFVIATHQAGMWIRGISIDECGDYRIKGKKESDHNTRFVHHRLKERR